MKILTDDGLQDSFLAVRVLAYKLRVLYGYPNMDRAEERARQVVQCVMIEGKPVLRDALVSALQTGVHAEHVPVSDGAIDDLVKVLTEEEVVRMKRVTKTYAGWQASDKNLAEYLTPGDCVDTEMYEYIRDCVPPYDNPGYLQLGEPYDSNDEGRSRFVTLERYFTRWVYVGILPNYERALVIQ